VPTRLQRYQRDYRALADTLAAELATIGFISAGSVVSRYTSCGKPGCRCQADPPQRHGPYYQWSHAVAGKTTSRRLNQAEAELYRSWITNRRRIGVPCSSRITDPLRFVSGREGLNVSEASCVYS